MLYLDVIWYEWKYKVNHIWTVISKERKVWNWHAYNLSKERILKPSIANWYYFVYLYKDWIWKKFYIHRLVAECFLWTNKMQVNHKDWNKLNNNISNLEYVTSQQNIQHAYDTWLKKPAFKKMKQLTKDWKLIKVWESIKDIEKNYPWIRCALSRGNHWWWYLWEYL